MADFRQINKEVKCEDFLEREGIHPATSTSDGKLYYPHFFDGKHHHSLKFVVDTVSNRWFDHHAGYDKGDTVINLAMKMKGLNAHDAAEYLAKLFNIERERKAPLPVKKTSIMSYNGNVEIVGVLDGSHLYETIKGYLNKRGIYKMEYVQRFCQQVFFVYHTGEYANKKLFGLGFKNRSGGYEIRNNLVVALHKFSIGTKDIMIADFNSDKWLVMEGFIDFLSLPEFSGWKSQCNVIVLNSTNLMERSFSVLDHVPGKDIFLLLDRDDKGNEATRDFLQRYPDAMDIRPRVLGYHNDLNERLVSERQMCEKEMKLFKWSGSYV